MLPYDLFSTKQQESSFKSHPLFKVIPIFKIICWFSIAVIKNFLPLYPGLQRPLGMASTISLTSAPTTLPHHSSLDPLTLCSVSKANHRAPSQPEVGFPHLPMAGSLEYLEETVLINPS